MIAAEELDADIERLRPACSTRELCYGCRRWYCSGELENRTESATDRAGQRSWSGWRPTAPSLRHVAQDEIAQSHHAEWVALVVDDHGAGELKAHEQAHRVAGEHGRRQGQHWF